MCVQEGRRLHEKYYPIEIDTTLSEAEKIPFMVEWWQQAHQNLVREGVQRQLFAHAVSPHVCACVSMSPCAILIHRVITHHTCRYRS